MTLIYVPVLIETAEQAEALPVGTIATFSTPGLTTAAVKNKGPLPGWWLGDERVSVGETPGWTAPRARRTGRLSRAVGGSRGRRTPWRPRDRTAAPRPRHRW